VKKIKENTQQKNFIVPTRKKYKFANLGWVKQKIYFSPWTNFIIFFQNATNMKRFAKLCLQKNNRLQLANKSQKSIVNNAAQSRFMTSQYFSVEDYERAGSLKEKVYVI